MDTLRKAEQARQVSLPKLPPRLEILDEEFRDPRELRAAPKPEAPPVSGGPGTAQGVARQILSTRRQSPVFGRAFTAGSVILVAVAGLGFHFGAQLQPTGGSPVPPPPPPSSAAFHPTTIAVSPLPAQPALPQAGVAEPARPAATVKTDHAQGEYDPSAAPPRETPIRLIPSKHDLDSTLAALARGFSALSAGNFAAARADYEQVLRDDPRNGDALRGMATLALREGRPDEAQIHYQRAIEFDPQDALAQAGLAGLEGQEDPLTVESHLKNLLAGQPDQPALHFALGNLHARQNRWGEARQSYTRAAGHAPDHPDYLFNLAISLDHLRQSKLAAQHYRQALAAAVGRLAGFDRDRAEIRLRELQRDEEQ